MKKLLLLLLLYPVFIYAQETPYIPNIQVDPSYNKINFNETVQMDSLSKEQIYWKAKDWFTRYFEFGRSYITMDSPAEGRIIGHATIFGKTLVGVAPKYITIVFNIVIDVRDKKYRYQFTDYEILDGLTDSFAPDIFSADRYINDPKYKDKNGNFAGRAKKHLEILEGNTRYIIGSLKAAIASKEFDSHIVKDEF